MSKKFALLLASTLALTLYASASTVSAAPVLPAKKAKPVQITGFAWQKDPVVGFDGEIFTQVIATFANPNARLFAQFPTFRVTARSAEGRVLYSDTWVTNAIPPRGAAGWATQIESRELPASVEIKFLEADWITSKPRASAFKAFTSRGLAVNSEDPDDIVITGEIINPYPVNFDSVNAVVVFRDESGAVIGGGSTYVDSVAPRDQVPFSDSLFTWTNGSIASLELVAQPHADSKLEEYAVTGRLK